MKSFKYRQKIRRNVVFQGEKLYIADEKKRRKKQLFKYIISGSNKSF